jgi:AraC family transcriptional regulator
MQIVRRTLFESELLRVGHVVARPSSSECGEIERQVLNILVLPLAGVFAKHDGPRRHVIATPNHAVFIAAGSPYRISYPAGIGDQCLTLWFSSAALARALPQALSRDGFDSSAFASQALLAPAAMLARSLLWRQLSRGEWDPLEVEELSIGLVASALHAARKDRHGRSRNRTRGRSDRRLRQVECVKEAISLHPERKWTIGKLAELACVSPYHLAHVFRVEMGVSVYQYVLRSRLAKALDAVLEFDTDLTAIAFETGFASHSHFTARFRALFGLTPVQLRGGASSGKIAELRRIVTAGPLAAE